MPRPGMQMVYPWVSPTTFAGLGLFMEKAVVPGLVPKVPLPWNFF